MSKSMFKAIGLGLLLVLASGAKADDQSSSVYLQTIGATTGSHMYTTYMYIGVVADSFGKNVYEAKQVGVMMVEVSRMCETVNKYLGKVSELKLSQADQDYIAEVSKIYGFLQQEANALANFSKTRANADLNAYKSARDAALPRIKKQLGLADAPAAPAGGRGASPKPAAPGGEGAGNLATPPR